MIASGSGTRTASGSTHRPHHGTPPRAPRVSGCAELAGVLSDSESDHDWIDPLVDDAPDRGSVAGQPSFRDLLEGALSSKSGAELQYIVDKARKPTQLQLQTAFGRLYTSQRAMQLALLPPRPSVEEDEFLSAPNKSAIRDLQEASRHTAALIQGVYTLTEALWTDKMDEVRISQSRTSCRTASSPRGARPDVRSSVVTSVVTPQDTFRYPILIAH